MDLTPSQVRAIILDGHKLLREKLVQMEDQIKTIERQKTAGGEQKLLDLLSSFNKLFLEHIHLEEQILRPALKDIDAWGEVRVDQMEKDHAEQRILIANLADMMSKKYPSDFIPYLRKFIKGIYQDIESEEKECLSPDVLRDDIITINFSSG